VSFGDPTFKDPISKGNRKPHLLLQDLLAPGEELRNIAEQKIHQGLAVFFRMHQRRLTLEFPPIAVSATAVRSPNADR